MKKYADAESSLKKMKQIMEFAAGRSISKELFENLLNKEKLQLRVFAKRSVKKLMAKRVITNIHIVQLRNIVDKCFLVMMEDEESNLNTKIMFEDTRRPFCGRPETTHATLLNFVITN